MQLLIQKRYAIKNVWDLKHNIRSMHLVESDCHFFSSCQFGLIFLSAHCLVSTLLKLLMLFSCRFFTMLLATIMHIMVIKQ